MPQYQHLVVSLTDEQAEDASKVADHLGFVGNPSVRIADMLKSLLQSTVDGHKALTEDGD